MKAFKFITALMLLTSVPMAMAHATATDSTALRLVADGKDRFAQNEFKKAEQAFRKALKKDPQLTAAMAGIGEVLMAKGDWGDANDWYEKILKLEPQNLEAMYHRGVCYRESGKFKNFLLRKFDWDNSARYFERVLAQDSSFRDTIYQYAQLLRYRGKYTEAILLGHRQIRLRPDLVEGQRGLFQFYQRFLDSSSEDEALDWLQTHDSEHARYFIGETYRRAGEVDSAAAVLRQWLAAKPTISLVPAYLSLARLEHERDLPIQAEKYFVQAVDGIRDRLDAELVFDDVKYIATEKELQEFRQLAAPDGYSAFFRNLWIKRDPTGGQNIEQRLLEHYRRLLYAEKYCLDDDIDTWANNPDKLADLKFPVTYYLNDRFNDKGLIYLRHGEPSERVVTVAASIPNESWRYEATNTTPEMIFHFAVAHLAAGNNWRMIAFMRDPRILADRLFWIPAPYRYLRRDLYLQRWELENALAQQSAAAAKIGFSTDSYVWNE